MIKNKYVAFVVFVVLFLIIWNALQYFMGKFENGYDVNNNILMPLVVSVACAYVTYLRDDPFKKKEEEQKKAEAENDAAADENSSEE